MLNCSSFGGLSRGSRLGPVLFNIHIYVLVLLVINCHKWFSRFLFPEDIVFFSVHRSTDLSIANLNDALTQLSYAFYFSFLELVSSNSNVTLFSRTRIPQNLSQFHN